MRYSGFVHPAGWNRQHNTICHREAALAVVARGGEFPISRLLSPRPLSLCYAFLPFRAFFRSTQTKQIPTEMPSALRSALASPPKVEVRKEAGKSSEAGAGATLLVPLGPSPFHRLLLHALCQYQKLRSKSESRERNCSALLELSWPASL